jgi:hypothetical protein
MVHDRGCEITEIQPHTVTVLTARNTKTTKPNSDTNPANSAAIAQPITNPGYHLRPPRTSHHITQVSRSISLRYPFAALLRHPFLQL